MTEQAGNCPSYKPKLIEVAIPLDDISRESAREKSIRHGHPSTLHLWWARRPLAACRAVLFAQMVDDPSAHPEVFKTPEDQAAERTKLHHMISELIKWENVNNHELLEAARQKILESCGGEPPPILDPFAGGGSIPLEAQRLGLDACGRDLNPVAVLINKALLEIPPRWSDHYPVYPGASDEAAPWTGATGLTEDVLRYGRWLCDETEKRIGHMYPKATISGIETTVIAWIWARTIACPNPRCRGITPLVGSFWLGRKKGRERYVQAIPDGKRVRFEIRNGLPGHSLSGNVSKNGVVCLICDEPAPLEYVRTEGKAKRIGSQLMAVVAQGTRQRHYLPPDVLHEEAARVPRPDDVPEEEIGHDPRNLWCVNYGLTTFADLFTNRQLTTMMTLTELVREARDRVIGDGAERAYADAVAAYLALAVSRVTDRHCSLSTWDSHESKEQVRGVFARQSLPMTWDYSEGNPFSSSSGNLRDSVEIVAECIRRLPANPPGTAIVEDAAFGETGGRLLVATDPPYYDNISYANLSDFYYVWLRRSLGDTYPELMSTVVTAKHDEIVADPTRHGGADAARRFYEERFEQAFRRICKDTPAGYPISFFYAYKQTKKEQDGLVSTAWEILISTLLTAGWMITASWPIRTELSNRPRGQSSNALGTSVVLTCRPRPANAPDSDRRGFLAELRMEMPSAIRMLVDTGIGPADLRQAMIGPGMRIFSKHAQVYESDGEPMSVGAALKLINQVFDNQMSHVSGEISAETRWCIDWFTEHGFDAGPYPRAEALARSTNTDVESLQLLGMVKSHRGNVSLVPPWELTDSHETRRAESHTWSVALWLAGLLRERGSREAVALLASLRSQVDLESVREIAYLAYTTAEKKGWQQTATLFKDLGTSWSDLERESRLLTHQYRQDPIDGLHS
jgi:putative DNA methylase